MARRVFEATERLGIRFAYHPWGTVLEVIPAAQLGACWSEDVVVRLEYPCHASDGCVKVKTCPFIPGPWSLFSIVSPLEKETCDVPDNVDELAGVGSEGETVEGCQTSAASARRRKVSADKDRRF